MLCTSLLLVGMDLTVLHVAVPTLTAHLRPSQSQLLWIVDTYSLTVAALLVSCGTIGDRVGRKRMLAGGFAVFGLASAAATACSTAVALIAVRAGLGIGAAMIMSATVSIIRTVFPDDRERATAIGLWTASHSVGAAIGPLVGGLLLQRFPWGSVFAVNVPVVAVALVLTLRLVPESRDPAPRRWDAAGAALSVAGLGGTVFALKRFGEHSGADTVSVAAILAGVALLGCFVLRQRRTANPLLDLSLFADRRFTMATVCVLGGFGCYTALLFLLSQRFQLIDGDSPVRAGLAMLPIAAANAAGAITAPALAARWSGRWVISGGLALFALALAVPGGVVSLAVAGIGSGLVMTLGADAIMSAARPEQAGEAAGIQETAFELGAGLGVVVLGTVLTLSYHPDQPAGPARDQAFETGYTAAVGTAAVLLALLAALSATLLRPPRRASTSPT
ncbi:MFS transporter [Amycolatopsis nigrescens]|uniref:MFS transporter n=1 Tax=Amycolatopsis nigrescens TaxID=381445 RepID=UPI001FDF3193|nr:MFS transporter [Amycolatopsis nigrescens]